MSDIKRAQLIPLGGQKDSDKPPKEHRKTTRISVVLPESTEDTCPEYSYKDELAAAKKKGKNKETKSAVANGVNRIEELDGDDDDDVRRIARQMEAKYGTTTAVGKKKRKGRKDDYADIGMGYDESDSFIDNTDGYDEMIPQNVTTLHGGFYINSGALEFKTDDEAHSGFASSSDDEVDRGAKARRKRVIESSDETDKEDKTESDNKDTPGFVEKKRKMQNGSSNGMQQAYKKKLMVQSKIYIKKRRPLDPLKKTVKELLREKREDLNMSIPNNLNSDISIVEENAGGKGKHVTDTIEAVIKAAGNGDGSKPNENDVTPIIGSKPIGNSDVESSHDANAVKGDVKLPENLQQDILDVIAAVKTAVVKNHSENKNVFSSDVNNLILRLERKCKCLGKPSKLKVYEHLAVFFKCKMETLIRKAKTLVLDDEQKKLRNLLSGLHAEVNKIMPGLLENYEKDSQKVLQRKFSQENVENEEVKSLRMPKRRFQWNDVTKKFLKEILMMKKRCLLLEGKSKEALDDLMTAFLRTEIQILWPDGWMSMNALNKIYTTYADAKRTLNTSGSVNPSPVPLLPASTHGPKLPIPVPKNLSQGFSTSNLSITPILHNPHKIESNGKVNDLTVSKSSTPSTSSLSDLTVQPLPETTVQPICDTIPSSSPPPPKRELEGKVKVKSPTDLLVSSNSMKPPDVTAGSDDSLIILETPLCEPPLKLERSSSSKSSTKQERGSPSKTKQDENSYCQVIDLSDKTEFVKPCRTPPEPKPQSSTIKRDYAETTISPCIPTVSDSKSHVAIKPHHDISITPSFPSATVSKFEKSASASSSGATSASSSTKDDIQRVMEGLKVLQKMSSPKKCTVDTSPSSSAVSVIAVNKSFQAPKTSPSFTTSHSSQPASSMHRVDYPKADYNTSFQDEFQKQLYSALNQMTTSTTKSTYNSIDRYPHISSSPNMVTADKYFQTANNNYPPQSSNGHTSSTSNPQPGTYSILDDMFANLLTQYGYSKEATAPKSHHHHHHHHQK